MDSITEMMSIKANAQHVPKIKETNNYTSGEKFNQDTKLKCYYASGMSFVEGRWQSCGWTIEANSFVEAAQIAENDKTFRIHSLSDNVMY